jgi:hypothetical protein
MKTRFYMLSLVAFAMASFLLVHFCMIWVYGRFFIYESNTLVLILETIMIVAIMGFSLYCLLEHVLPSRKMTQNRDHIHRISQVD